VREFCSELNISLEFRPVKHPDFGGFIESAWDTINDAIRNAKLPGRVFSLPKSRESVKRPQYKAPPDYNAKDKALLTFDEFKEWLYAYIVVHYSTDTRARQNLSPNEKWQDGVKGKNHQPLGGALRILSPNEYKLYEFKSKEEESCILSQKGLRYKNILYTSPWLVQARKDRVLVDGERYYYRISDWDVRTIQMLNPGPNNKGEIETLKAYKYEGDDLITEFLLRGLGEVPGYRPYIISKNMLSTVKKSIGQTNYDPIEKKMVMEQITEKVKQKGKLNKKERQLFDDLSKSKEGRTKIAVATVLSQMDEEPVPPREIEDKIEVKDELSIFGNDDVVEAYPTEWEEVKKKMDFPYSEKNTNTREKDEKEKKEK